MTSTATYAGRPAAYRPVAKALHWIIAILVFAQFPAGVVMLQEGIARSTQDALFIFHKNTGVVILLLLILRLAVRLIYPPPHLPATVPPWQVAASRASHWGLYLLLFVMTLSGYIRVKAGGFPIEYLDAMGVPSLVAKNESVAGTAKAIHAYARFFLFALLALHIGAALYHLIVRRDGVFQRMWPGRG